METHFEMWWLIINVATQFKMWGLILNCSDSLWNVATHFYMWGVIMSGGLFWNGWLLLKMNIFSCSSRYSRYEGRAKLSVVRAEKFKLFDSRKDMQSCTVNKINLKNILLNSMCPFSKCRHFNTINIFFNQVMNL